MLIQKQLDGWEHGRESCYKANSAGLSFCPPPFPRFLLTTHTGYLKETAI